MHVYLQQDRSSFLSSARARPPPPNARVMHAHAHTRRESANSISSREENPALTIGVATRHGSLDVYSDRMADSGGTDPKKLEGRGEDASSHRDFFWDSITLYVVGIIIALAAIDAVTEFLRGSSVSCLLPSGQEEFENYVNSICASSLPITEYFPVFIVIQGILIAIPHYLWLNHYGGNFEFFFQQAKAMDRIRDAGSGEYSENNYIVVQQLTVAFSTFKKNWMFILYVVKLFVQCITSIAAFFVAVFYFHDFEEVFICPQVIERNPINNFTMWPLDTQVQCVFSSLRLFGAIRLANLILLALLILCFLWSFVWCFKTHSAELGSEQVAYFSFETGMSPQHHIPLGVHYRPILHLVKRLFSSMPWLGPGPHIRTNLDFLVLKLFRTDSGLGFIFREMQVLQKIRHLNDDDQRRTNLHRRQQGNDLIQDGGECCTFMALPSRNSYG